MAPTIPWHLVTASEFEELALEHVRDVYPEFTWRSTPLTKDGGKDAIGELSLRDNISEIYWMEAKHHPTNHSIGKYTLDTHLVSAFFSSEVKRLHVVTSGSLTTNFLHRAHLFSKEHSFIFAFSDREAVEAWLAARRDLVHEYFSTHASKILHALEQTGPSKHNVFARALLVADNDNLTPSSVQVPHLVPGKKFRLVVSVSVAAKLAPKNIPLRLHWSVPPRISLLAPADADTGAVLIFDPVREPIISIPFRLLSFGSNPLPNAIIHAADGEEITQLSVSANELPRLTSPFVGQVARDELLRLKRLLRDEVSIGRPKLVVCRARAGSGKTRLAEEFRDDAQRLGFTVRLIEMPSTPRSQEDCWNSLFRWIFGLEGNPFNLPEEEVIRKRLGLLDLGLDEKGRIEKVLKGFLIGGIYSEDLFNLDLPEGRLLVRTLREALGRRFDRQNLLHIDDAHHLSRRQLRPLYLLRHLMETSDSLPLCLLVTARNDETVRDDSFEHFVSGLRLSDYSGFHLIDLPEMTQEDAKELVATTLRWPELLAKESKTLSLIVERAGTNPFFLMQTLDHLAVDHGTVSFGHGEGYFLIDIPGFKRALRGLPKSVRDLLSRRFNGLLRRGERKLLLALVATAIIGRRASRHVVNQALGRRLTTREVGRLVELGYLASASGQQFELAHDLLAETLRARPEARRVAAQLASAVRNGKVNLVEDQMAAVYYAAGKRYYRKSWEITRRIIEGRFQRQEYLNLTPLIERLEHIAEKSNSLSLDSSLKWVAAIAEQHGGNTYTALTRFLEIKENAKETLPKSSDTYIDATIEAGNQYILRAEPTAALASISDALSLLSDPDLQLVSDRRGRLAALAHNRCGAALHLVERRMEAVQQFDAALLAAAEGGDDYLTSHTYWDLAALLRIDDPKESARYLQEARRIWDSSLRYKERFRIMIDTSEAYTACLRHNSLISRSRLRAITAEASEKGYLFQACSALLCLSTCCLAAEEYREAKAILLRVLDLTTTIENLNSRVFAFHYLSACAHLLGTEVETRDWALQAKDGLNDPAFEGTELSRCIHYNRHVLDGGSRRDAGTGSRQAGLFHWRPWNRA